MCDLKEKKGKRIKLGTCWDVSRHVVAAIWRENVKKKRQKDKTWAVFRCRQTCRCRNLTCLVTGSASWRPASAPETILGELDKDPQWWSWCKKKDKRQKTKDNSLSSGQPSYSHLLTPRFLSTMVIVMMILLTLTMNNNCDQDHFQGNNLNIPTTLLTDYFENDNGVKLKERISWQWTFGQWWWHRLERRLLRDP